MTERTPITDRWCEFPVLVQDRATGLPLPSVPVELRRATSERVHAATSSADGRCRLANLEPGDYALMSGSSADLDYATDPMPVTLSGDVHEEVVLRVERRWFLAGVVVQAGSDRPIDGVGMTARVPDGRLSHVAMSAEGGRFRSRRSYAAGVLSLFLSEEETRALVRTQGPVPELHHVAVGQEDVTRLLVEVDWIGVLRGVVLDPHDHRIAHAELRVLSGDSIYLENASLRGLALGDQDRGRGHRVVRDAC